jgi:DNA polymerase elongation subunit (family B)
MATLVFDIETNGIPWGDLPGMTRSALTHWVEKGNYSDEEKVKKLSEVKARTALSPFTGNVLSLAVYDIERNTGAVYYQSEEVDDSFTVGDFKLKQRTEKEILEDFWDGANSYDVFVSFNGRSFALPFVYHRSIMLGVKPTIDIARQRYVTRQASPYHIDLLDEYSFYGAMSHRPSLQLLSSAYQIDNTSLLGGEEIAEAFSDKRFRTIAEKNAGDVEVITKLYELWLQNLAPRSFLNAIEI